MSIEKSLSMPASIAAPGSPAVVMQGVFTDIDQKNACEAASGFWEGTQVIRLTTEQYESRLAGIRFPDLAFGAEYAQGTIRMQGALAQDTLYLTFTGGKLSIMGSRPQPTLNIIGPGTEADAMQRGEISFHSVFLRGSMLTRLLAGTDGDLIARRWLAPGLHRPFVSEVEAGWLYQLLSDLAGLVATVPAELLKPSSLRLARDDVLAATRATLISAEPELTTGSIGTASRRRALALAVNEASSGHAGMLLGTVLCPSYRFSARHYVAFCSSRWIRRKVRLIRGPTACRVLGSACRQ